MNKIDKSDEVKEPSMLIDESISNYYTDIYSPGETKEQLEIGKEVRGSSGAITATQISGSTFSVNDNTQTQVTNLSTILGDSSLTGTANAITIGTTGIYQILASTRWQGGAAQPKNTHVAINGTVNFSVFGTITTGSITNYGFKILSLSAGDVVTLELYQNTGGALNTDYNNLAVIKLI